MNDSLPPTSIEPATPFVPLDTSTTTSESVHPAVAAFDQLVASRTDWIESFLKPWCRTAPRLALLRAHQEWGDIAGKVDPDHTLWLWGWSRFPHLYVDGLSGLEESFPLCVVMQDGTETRGYPDARASRYGYLALVPVDADAPSPPPLSIDDIASITRVES